MKTNKKLLSKYNRAGLLASTLIFLLFSSCVDVLYPPNVYNNRNDSTGSFPAPTGFNARQSSKTTVLITWSEAGGALGYIVERAIDDDGDYEIIYDGTGTSYTDTINSPGSHKYFYRVTTYYNDESSSTSPKCVVFQAITVDASEYANIPGADANGYGVYQVKIEIGWEKPDGEDNAYVQIQRSESSGSGFTTISNVALSEATEDSEGFYSYSYIDNNTTAKVAKKYYYRARILNDSDHVLLTSEEDTGWGALTHEQYMIEYNKVMNTALGRLKFMYDTSGLTTQLGTEDPGPAGNISGNIYYKASTLLISTTITIKLTKYADFYIDNDPSKGMYFILDGNSNTTVNTSANGNMNGKMTIEGMYPGTVHYGTSTSTTPNANAGITIGKGDPSGGFYLVTPDGFTGKNVDYNHPGIFRAYSYYNAASYPELPSYYQAYTTASKPNGPHIEEQRAPILQAERDNPDFINKRLPWLNW